MARYWVIAPYDSTKPDVFERVWKYDLENKVIAVGWRELGDISGLDELTLKERIKETYEAKKPQGELTKFFNQLWAFYHEIKEGDIIIARKGRKTIAAIGTVTQTAFYNDSRGKESVGDITDHYYSNFIGVEWHNSPRDLVFDKQVFSFTTLYEIMEDKYKSLIDKSGPEDASKEAKEHHEFVLEKYLEDFIVSNFDKIFKGKLTLYKDPETGEIAQQYPTEIGNIDILTQEPSSNSFVVIELKKGQEADKVVGQTLRYMGWVKGNLCEDDQGVKGLIICKKADDKLLYALKVVNNIDLKYYSVDFKLFDKETSRAGL